MISANQKRDSEFNCNNKYYYGDISPVEKGEIADSILYLTLDVFFEVLDHCSQNSSRGSHLCEW